MRPLTSCIRSIFHVCMETNALGKTTKCYVALRFFAVTSSMIRRRARILMLYIIFSESRTDFSKNSLDLMVK